MLPSTVTFLPIHAHRAPFEHRPGAASKLHRFSDRRPAKERRRMSDPFVKHRKDRQRSLSPFPPCRPHRSSSSSPARRARCARSSFRSSSTARRRATQTCRRGRGERSQALCRRRDYCERALGPQGVCPSESRGSVVGSTRGGSGLARGDGGQSADQRWRQLEGHGVCAVGFSSRASSLYARWSRRQYSGDEEERRRCPRRGRRLRNTRARSSSSSAQPATLPGAPTRRTESHSTQATPPTRAEHPPSTKSRRRTRPRLLARTGQHRHPRLRQGQQLL